MIFENKVHEIIDSEEEAHRTIKRGSEHYVIQSILPELKNGKEPDVFLEKEFSSADSLMNRNELTRLMKINPLMFDDADVENGEMLR